MSTRTLESKRRVRRSGYQGTRSQILLFIPAVVFSAINLFCSNSFAQSEIEWVPVDKQSELRLGTAYDALANEQKVSRPFAAEPSPSPSSVDKGMQNTYSLSLIENS